MKFPSYYLCSCLVVVDAAPGTFLGRPLGRPVPLPRPEVDELGSTCLKVTV